MLPVGTLVALAFLPAVASVLGGVAMALRSPSTPVESAIQHFAAGAVLAAVAELLADLPGRPVWLVVAGLVAGVGFVLVMERVTDAIEGRASAGAVSRTAGLLVAMGADTLLDGFLAGLVVGAIAHGGLVLVLAFAVEMVTFGLAAGAALPGAVSPGRVVGVTAALGVCFPIGMLVGAALASGLSGLAVGFVVALGVSVLVYLVTDELLAEAREEYESTGTLLAFFAGFVALYALAFAGGPA